MASDVSHERRSPTREMVDEEFITNVELTDPTVDETKLMLNRGTTFGFRTSPQRPTEEFVITAAHLHRSGFKDECLRVIKQPPEKNAQSETTDIDRWLHVETDDMSRETFQTIAKNYALRYDVDMLQVVHSVLEEVWSNYEVQSARGCYFRPGAVRRCDGIDPEQPFKPDISATFIAFPYFDIGKCTPSQDIQESSTHMPRGLFQNAYLHETTHDRDADQMFRKFEHNEKSDYLRVSQLWALVLRSRTIITCSPSPLPDMFHDVDFVAANDLLIDEPSRIHVTDHLRRVMYLPLEDCSTYVGLRHALGKCCFNDTETAINECIITAGDSEDELEPGQWPAILKSRTSPFVYVRLCLKEKRTKRASTERGSQIGSPKATKLIEYGTLDSDDGDSKAEKMALVVSKHRIGKFESKSDYLKAIQRRLDKEGYVVNNVESLVQREHSRENPKIFHLPNRLGPEAKSLPLSGPSSLKENEVSSGREDSQISACQDSMPQEDTPHTQDFQEHDTFDGSSKSSSALPNNSLHPPGLGTSLSAPDQSSSAPHDYGDDNEYDGMFRLWDEGHVRPGGTPFVEYSGPMERESESSSLGHDIREEPADIVDSIRAEVDDLKDFIREELDRVHKKLYDKLVRTSLARTEHFESSTGQTIGENSQGHATQLDTQAASSRVEKKDVEMQALLDLEIPYRDDEEDSRYFILPGTDAEKLDKLICRTIELRDNRLGEGHSTPLSTESTNPQSSGSSSFIEGPVEHKADHAERNLGTVHSDEKPIKSPKPWCSIFNPQLDVPPFLAWPTNVVDNSPKSITGPYMSSLRYQSSSSYLFELSLYAIEEDMTKERSDLATVSIDPEHPYMHLYRTGDAFTKVPEATHDGVTKLLKSSQQEVFDHVHPPDELEFQIMSSLMNDTHALSKEVTEVLTMEGLSIQRLLGSTCWTARRSTQWQTTLMLEQLRIIVSSATSVVDQFVSKYHPHVLLRRCWGALTAIIEVITRICKSNHAHQKKDYDQEPSSGYSIRDMPNKEYAEVYNLGGLITPLKNCKLCKRKSHYDSVDDAVSHLVQFHVSETDQKLELVRQKLTHWVVSASGADLEESNQNLIRYMGKLMRQVERLQAKFIDLRNSVADENNQKPERYLLPSALVKAAENFFQMIYTSQYSVQSLYEDQLYNQKTDMTTSRIRRELNVHIDLLEHFGGRARSETSSARHALLLMAHTETTSNSVISVRSPPELMLLFCCVQLSKRPVVGNLCALSSYHEHLSSIRFQAGRRPKKQALRDLYLMEEELELVEAVHEAQRLALKAFGKVIDHRSYRITDRERVQTNEKIEKPMLNTCLVENPLPCLHYNNKDLQDQISKTTQVLRYNIEIAEEGNTKAIRVFTLVTIIFLPLSFISSVFGMNTVDIRDTNNTQVVFWIIAIPITALIGGFSLLIAYRGTQMWSWLRGQSSIVHAKACTILDWSHVKKRKQRPRDEEVLAGNSEEVVERWMRGLNTKRRTRMRAWPGMEQA